MDVKRGEIPFSTIAERDWALANYLADLGYTHNAGYARGSLMFQGFLHNFEDHGDKMPTAARAPSVTRRYLLSSEKRPKACPPQRH